MDRASKFDASDRYSRQELFGPIGRTGQQRLSASSVTLIGCGALGSNLAQMMVRAGLGRLRIVDRDYLELSNLQRQVLFDEQDVVENMPKSVAAARKLAQINSNVTVEPIVADVNYETIEQFIDGSDLILDGTDNLQTRFLINDAAIKHGLPWIYGACVGAKGLALAILPAGRPCLRCLFDEPGEPAAVETCDTAGIIGPIASIVASLQAAEAIKILTGNLDAVNHRLVSFDTWANLYRSIATDALGNDCKCCCYKDFEFLAGKGSLSTISLCGRNSVQLRPRRQKQQLDMAALADRLAPAGAVYRNEFIVRLDLPDRTETPGRQITIFPDGRAIIKGTDNIDEARSLYAKYIGH